MKHTRGHIQRLPSGTWRWRLERNGALVASQTFPKDYTRRQVEDEVARLLTRYNAGEMPAKSDVTLDAAIALWLDAMQPRMRAKTERNYRDCMRHWQRSRIGALEVQKVSAAAIAGVVEEWRQAGVAHTTLLQRLSRLRSAFTYLEGAGIVGKNVAALVMPPKLTDAQRDATEERLRTWTLEEWRHFLQVSITSPYHLLYRVAGESGLREGEVAALRWQDVDLKTGRVEVRQSVQRVPRRGLVWTGGKTKTARRVLYLAPATVALLRDHHREYATRKMALGAAYGAGLDGHGDLVFAQADGQPLHMHNVVRRDFQKMAKAAGLPRMRFHNVRRLAAGVSADVELPENVRRERMGHADDEMTLHYTPTWEQAHQRAAERIAQRLYGTVQGGVH